MPDTAPDPPFVRFGDFGLDLRSGELMRNDTRLLLPEQPFRILARLLRSAGTLVTRDELRHELWRQDTFVDFEHSLNAAVKRLRAALGDNADSPRFVETLPRRGYRFIAPFNGGDGAPARAARPRLAVLPFSDDGLEIAREFSDGLTDEMMLQLGRLEGHGVDIVARSSSLAFRGGACLARDIGATLRADYLLEGSVRRQGERARIAAWLIETSGETQVWTGVYDRCLTDALSVQTDVASRIAGSLASEIRPVFRA
jgi:TolB-like protein